MSMASQYTTKTASLRATKADIKKLDAKQMMLNGENITELWGLNLPKDYKKLVTRCELPDDKNWMLLNDNGDLVYFNFSEKIKNGSGMFKNAGLENFVYKLSSLTNGNEMFSGCSLNAESVDAILDSIPTNDTRSGKILTLTVGESGCYRISELLGIDPISIPKHGGGVYSEFSFAGWTLQVSTTAENISSIPPTSCCPKPECPEPPTPECPECDCKCSDEGDDFSDYEVVEGGNYIPDANNWHDEVYIPNELYSQITEITDGYAYNDAPECDEPECGGSCCAGSGDGELSQYEVVDGGAYIPNANDWHDEVYVAQGLNSKITEIADGYAYSNN